VAASQQYTTTSSAQLIASAPAEQAVVPGPTGWVYLTNGSGGSLYLGGPNVSSSNGAAVAASATWSGWLFPGDSLYVIQDSASSVIGVLQTGA
jgi:hypothetical protein